MDGRGKVHKCSRIPGKESEVELFYAAGISMGLFGILTDVTFKCIRRFDIIGTETTADILQCKEFDTTWSQGCEFSCFDLAVLNETDLCHCFCVP